MDNLFFVLLFITLAYEGNCLKSMICLSSNSPQEPIDVVDQGRFNKYGEPYAPWWSIFQISCNQYYRSPLLDYWTQLNVTKLQMNVMNKYKQVFYTEQFDINSGGNITEMMLNPNLYNRSFFLTGMNGMDFLVTDPTDTRRIKFGILPGPDLTRHILSITDGYYSIPHASDLQVCMHLHSNGIPSGYTFISNVSNQEQCVYECYRRNNVTALLYSHPSESGHVCHCYDTRLTTGSPDIAAGDLCGDQCEGDILQSCGNRTHAVVLQAYDAVHDGFMNEESLATVISITIPMSGEIEVNLTNSPLVNQDGKVFLTKIEVSDEQWPDVKVVHSQFPCGTDGARIRSHTFSLSADNGTKWVDKLMAACMILRNDTELVAPLQVNLTFSPNHVLFPSRFVLEAEFENDVCEYKDVGVVEDVIPDSNIDVWYPVSSSSHVSTINHAGVLIGANKKPFPGPRIMAYTSTGTYSYVSHVLIKTTASNIKIDVTNCVGLFENRTLTRVSQSGFFNVFNATNLVAGETFTCLDLIVIEIETDDVTSYESYIFYFYITGCTSASNQPSTDCQTVTELTGSTPGFPYDRIVIHSSSTDIGPAPVKPCDDSLFITRASFAEPMIITVILLNDDRRGSLAVNYIRVVGAVDSINLQYTQSYSDNSVITLPFDNITINGDELEADFSPTNMYAVRIVDATKGTFHNITDIVIKACILTAEILEGTYVNDTRFCEETTTTTTPAPTTTTTPATTTATTTPAPTTTTTTTTSTTTTTPDTTTAAPTTTTTPASTTAMECCPCTPVRPTISIQQAEEKAEQLAKELQVDVSTLSSTIRKKTSAKDERPSAKMVGSIGAVLLSLTLGLVIILDADYMYKIYRMIQKWRRLQHKLKLQKEKTSVDADGPEKE